MIPWLIAFTIVKLKVNRPTYRLDPAPQSPMSNFHSDIRVQQVTICAYNDTEIMLRINDRYALKVNVLSPLPQRVTLSAVLNA